MPPSKKRKLGANAVDEIIFDPNARTEYLTGFHKRKLQRAKYAQEQAAKKERAEKIEERKKMREERRLELERHIKEVNGTFLEGGITTQNEGSEDEWSGFSNDETTPLKANEPLNDETEYIDEGEDKHTTVTVEAVNVDRDGFHLVRDEEDEEELVNDSGNQATEKDLSTGASFEKAQPPKSKKPIATKTKKKKFRYESKAERKVTRFKERGSKSRARERR
ncbi:MAG: hypothetical protein M1834_006235 [Cirrosporium novae-zelandiae]|nr:MAG: hypothetical protein M1834_006235 [Cirrosporium novae-zelandiae]